jgi:hypothetical protein
MIRFPFSVLNTHASIVALCRVQQICQAWYELGGLNSLWKSLLFEAHTPLVAAKVTGGDYKGTFLKIKKFRLEGEWYFLPFLFPFSSSRTMSLKRFPSKCQWILQALS